MQRKAYSCHFQTCSAIQTYPLSRLFHTSHFQTDLYFTFIAKYISFILISWSFTPAPHSNTPEAVASLWNLHKVFPAKSPRSQDLEVYQLQLIKIFMLELDVFLLFQHHFLEDAMYFLLFQEIIFSLRIRQPIVETNLRSKNWSRNRWLSLGGTSPRRSRSTTNWWLPRPVALGRMIKGWMMCFFLGGKGQFWDLHDL